MYKCPYCDKELKEVNTLELSVKKVIFSLLAGLSVGAIASSFFSPLGTAGGSVLGLLITFLFLGRP